VPLLFVAELITFCIKLKQSIKLRQQTVLVQCCRGLILSLHVLIINLLGCVITRSVLHQWLYLPCLLLGFCRHYDSCIGYLKIQIPAEQFDIFMDGKDLSHFLF